MPSYKCVYCRRTVRNSQQAIQCHSCDEWNHRTCGTGVSRAFYGRMTSGDVEFDWCCVNCQDAPDSASDAPSDDESDQTNQTFVISNRSFIDPVVLFESSLEDEGAAFSDVIVNEELPSIVFRIHEEGNTRLRRKLTDSRGFTYNVKRTSSEKVYWECSVRSKTNRCLASVVQHNDDFTLGLSDHTHPARPGVDITLMITAQVRRIALEDVCTGAASIVETAMKEHDQPDVPNGSLPTPANLRKLVKRVRQRMRTDDPVSQ